MKLILISFFSLFVLHAMADDCLKTPEPVCLADIAMEAAKLEPEGWGITALFEMLLATDPDLARREIWLNKYSEFAKETKIEGIKERLPAIRAEYLARLGKFEEAYKTLGLVGGKEDTNADPALLISDEAKAGHIKEALARIDKMMGIEARDDTRLDLLSIAIAQKYPDIANIIVGIKDKFTKRLAESTILGVKGDLKTFQKNVIEWVKAAKLENEFPFDTPTNAKFESYHAFLNGALLADNFESLKEGLAARGNFSTSDESEYIAKLLRVMVKTGRADQIMLLAPYIKLPAGVIVSADDDLEKLRKLTIEQLKANIKASELILPARASIIDQTVEALIMKRNFNEAVRVFIDNGRVEALNKATYDQDRVVPVFETVYRMAFAKNLPELAELTKLISHDKAKEFMVKIANLQKKLELLQNASLTEEPNEEDWSLMVDLLLHEGNLSKSAGILTRIKDAGLRSSAFTQLIRHIWEKS